MHRKCRTALQLSPDHSAMWAPATARRERGFHGSSLSSSLVARRGGPSSDLLIGEDITHIVPRTLILSSAHIGSVTASALNWDDGATAMLSVIAFFVVYAVQAAYFILRYKYTAIAMSGTSSAHVLTSNYLPSLKKCLVECRDQHVIAMSIAQCCVSLTVPISLYHCYEHLSCFTKPRLQSQIVRIICMVPVYSLEGMLSISYPEAAFYLQVLREWYEGFVIYSFMIYLLNFLTDEYPDLPRVLSDKPSSIGHHKHPFCFLPPWKMGKEFLNNCKAGVFQYVLIRCVLTVVSVPGFMLGYYVEGTYSISSLYTWMVGISCVSQMFALYSLFLFYHALHEEIYVLRPFAKFVCIKIVVFFSWFQGVAIEVLVQLGHISEMSKQGDDQSGHSVQEVAAAIQDLLICMEMFLAAIAFYNSFPVSEFSPNKLERDSILRRRKTSSDSASTQQNGPSLVLSAVARDMGSPSSGSVSPVTDTDNIVHISEVLETDGEEQLLLLPTLNRRLDLRERMRAATTGTSYVLRLHNLNRPITHRRNRVSNLPRDIILGEYFAAYWRRGNCETQD